MFEEAEAMIEAIKTLRDRNVPSLPVHDSLIVPKSAGSLAKETIESVFSDRFMTEFIVKGL